jgi:restriction endonuclease S subunit/uncharacterized C2H2 Zn-finger protein
MVKYDCERCAKSFDHKNDYAKHLNKKKPCNGDDNAPTLEILKQRLADLENTISAMNTTKNPEPVIIPSTVPVVVYNHPISREKFDEVISKSEGLVKGKLTFTTYKDYILDCFTDDGGSAIFDNETVMKWNRKSMFEDFFKKYHVLSVLGEKAKKTYTLAEYKKIFTRFVTYIENDEELTEIPTPIITTNNEAVSKFTTMVTRLENSLYKIGVVGNSARDSLIPLIILRLLQNHFESGEVEIMNMETNGCNKRRITEENVKYVLLKNYSNLSAADASAMLQVIWDHLLSQNPVTGKIFEVGKYVHIKNNSILMAIINELIRFDFESYSVDNLSLAYQYFIHKQFKGDNASKMGQHFTPDKLITLMTGYYSHLIPETGLYTDPFMGTGGFIMSVYNLMKDKRSTEDPNDYIYGTELDPNVFKYAFTNLLLQTGKVCTNIKNDSAFVNHDKKYAAIFTNPPFGSNIMKDQKDETLEYNRVKVLNRNLVCLQYCMHILAPGGICSMVWVYGSECYGDSKSFIEVRKRLFTEFHFEGAILFPEKLRIFEHTAVGIVILTFRKPIDEFDEVTPKLKIYMCDDKIENIRLITEANYEQLEANNFAIRPEAYVVKEKKKVSSKFEIKKLGDICEFLPTTNLKTSEGLSDGLYRFYSSSQEKKLFTNDPTINKESLIIGNGGMINIHYDVNFTPSKHVTVCQLKMEDISLLYLYYYMMYHKEILEDISRGATLKWINKTNLSNVLVPVPNLEKQEEIVAIVTELVKQLQNYDNVINGVNYQIDLIKKTGVRINPNYLIQTLDDICELGRGQSITKKELEGSGYLVIGGGEKPMGEHNAYNTEPDTILMSRMGSAGYVSIYDKFVYATESIIKILPNDGINKLYLYYYLKYNAQESIKSIIHGSAQPGLNATDLKKLEIPVPSLEEQENIIEEYKRMEAEVDASNKEIDMIKAYKEHTLTLIRNQFM